MLNLFKGFGGAYQKCSEFDELICAPSTFMRTIFVAIFLTNFVLFYLCIFLIGAGGGELFLIQLQQICEAWKSHLFTTLLDQQTADQQKKTDIPTSRLLSGSILLKTDILAVKMYLNIKPKTNNNIKLKELFKDKSSLQR